MQENTTWHHLIPEDWVSKEGNHWRCMSYSDRERETWINPKLRRLLPKWWRDQRAKVLKADRAVLARASEPEPLEPSPLDHYYLPYSPEFADAPGDPISEESRERMRKFHERSEEIRREQEAKENRQE